MSSLLCFQLLMRKYWNASQPKSEKNAPIWGHNFVTNIVHIKKMTMQFTDKIVKPSLNCKKKLSL